MFITGSDGSDDIYQYSLTNSFDLSADVTYDGDPFNLLPYEAGPLELYLNTLNDKLFVLGSTLPLKVNQFNISTKNVFIENPGGAGDVEGSMAIALTGDTFTHAGGTLTQPTHFTINNLPNGLIPNIQVASDGRSAILTFNGSATVRTDIPDLEFTFTNAAFTSGNASSVSNATNALSGLGIDFAVTPVFLTPSSISISEAADNTNVLDVDAFDGNFGEADQGLTYAISGLDATHFNINTSTGLISFINPADFENPVDGDLDNIYEITVTASRGAFSSNQNLIIKILDIVERIAYVAQPNIPTGTSFSGVSFNLNPHISAPSDILFSIDGMIMYALDANNERALQFNLTTSFDITSASLASELILTGISENPLGMALDNSGTKLFIVNNQPGIGTQNEILQFNMTTPYQINTASLKGVFNTHVTEDSPQDITFSLNGRKLFVIGSSNDAIYQYELSSPFDITSSSPKLETSFMIGSFDTNANDLVFDVTGRTMLIIGSNEINQFWLNNSFDLTGVVTHEPEPFNISNESISATGFSLDASQTRLFITGSGAGGSSPRVLEYQVKDPSIFIETPANDGTVSGQMAIVAIGELFSNPGSTLNPSSYAISNLPSGLIASLSIDTYGTVGNLTLNGAAVPHTNSEDVLSLIFSFTNNAIILGDISNVDNHLNASTGLGVDFNIIPQFNSSNAVTSPEGSLLPFINIQANDGKGGDQDAGISYAITGGVDQGFISINSTTGDLSFAISTDFETPVDTDLNNIYKVIITADRGGISTQQTVLVTVLNAQEILTYSTDRNLNAGYSFSNSFNASGQGVISITDAAFSNDGTKLFIIDVFQAILEYDLSIPFDVSTATFTNNRLGQANFPLDIAFDRTGTQLYVLNISEVLQYSISSAFDLSSTVTLQGSISIDQLGGGFGMVFNNDGSKLFVQRPSEVLEYTLGSRFNLLSSITLTQTLSVSESDIFGIDFNSEGTLFYLSSTGTNEITQYENTTPFDLSTSVSIAGSIDLSGISSNNLGMQFGGQGLNLIVGDGGSLDQFVRSSNFAFTENEANDGSVNGSLIINIYGDEFVNKGGTLDEGTHFSIANKPAGLTGSMKISADGLTAALSFRGNALENNTLDNVLNLEFTFNDNAFTSNNAPQLQNSASASSNLGISFIEGTLPVTLTQFFGQENDDKAVDLFWQTATEINNDKFVIYHSSNGTKNSFKQIGEVAGHGNSNEIINYQFEHPTTSNINYYYLKQVDYDGSNEDSKVIRVVIEHDNTQSISIYPNPLSGSELSVLSYQTEVISAKIVDMEGRVISWYKPDNGSLNNLIKLDIDNHLPNGSYFCILDTGSEEIIRKLMVLR